MNENEILINGRFLTRPISGVERVGREIIAELDARLDSSGVLSHAGRKFSFSIAMPHSEHVDHVTNFPFSKISVVYTGGKNRLPQSGHLWEQSTLPLFANGKYLLSLANSGPAFYPKQTVFMHDASVYAAPSAYSTGYKYFYYALYGCFRLSKPNVVTNSYFSKREIVERVGLSVSQIDVVSLGCDSLKDLIPDGSVIYDNGLKSQEYILIVASAQRNKNFARLLQALTMMGSEAPTCVVVGGSSHPSFKKLSLEFPINCIEVGRVSDEQLKALYQNAIGIVFPSLYEGFGLPPLEAMSCNSLALVSNRASLPEVCEKAALYCDPEDINSIAQGIAALVQLSPAERREKLAIARIQAQKYTWKKSVDRLLDHLATRTITANVSPS